MIIDAYYEAAVAKLTKEQRIIELSNKLKSIKTNDKRVLFVFEILSSLGPFPPVLEVKKSETVCVYYRNQGNKFFRESKNFEAWQYYNLSILHAPIESTDFCIALANRSAVLFSLKKYNDCLTDIDEVISLNKYPNNLMPKIMKRLELCKKNLKKIASNKKAEEIENMLKLDFNRNERYLCASDKLDVVYNKEMGRHVIAKEDIQVGEIIAHEEPYLTLLLKSQILFSCSYCLSRKCNLMPCNYCCFVLYCSPQCKFNAWKKYHSIECSLMATIIKMDFTKLEWLGLRTTIRARNDHVDWNSLFKTIKETDKNYDTEHRGHVKIEDKWIFDSKHYASIHTLESNVEKRSVSDIFQKCVTAAVFLSFLETKTEFLKAYNGENSEAVRKCVAGMLLLHIMTSPTNMHGISTSVQTAEGSFVDEISLASAPYAFHSLLNHSCAPNAVRYTKLGSGAMSLFALRPIKKGMQVYDNYGPHHALEDRMSRRAQLKFQYKFDCQCEACIDNWPQYFHLPSGRLPMNICRTKQTLLSPAVINRLQEGDLDTGLKLYKPLCELTGILETYAPCRELADCQESLKQCLVIFQGLIPYGYSQLVEWDAIPPSV